MTKSIDWQMLLKLTNNKPELAEELLALFASELPALRDGINAAFDKADWKEMKNQVHKLHGSCCYTGTPHLKHLSQELEEALELRNHGAVPLFLERLNSEIQRVLNAIQQENYAHDSF
ncbi:Hpt domain-containing protein [Coxiella burnetii]|uniref:Hpt domain-containing protein n=1 Tax=Coxiella burnetii TaxID=777 RepID=UPI000183CF55|nr:Hpt domain-containing protein [Coxiella burnetii]ACJ18939.1 Hpt domain protein [Coxiella burnetii CbuG_Q212]ATN67296.1 histidine kinase [Coxiella burnetii]OYK85478.1 histidine kinase [Coxiella burnetii]